MSTAEHDGRLLREVYWEATGCSAAFDRGPVRCPACGRDGVLEVRPVGPSFRGGLVRCANGCTPGAIAQALRLGHDALEALPADQPPTDSAHGAAPPLAASTYYTLRELLEDKTLLEPPAPLVAPFLYQGRVTLLSGAPKIGKSVLAANLATAIAGGAAFLGQQVRRGRVLVFSLDEFLGDTVRRFAMLDADPDQIDITIDPIGFDLENRLADSNYSLVVIDTLNELLSSRGRSLNRAEEVIPILRPVVDLLRRSGVAGLITGHTGKQSGSFLGAQQIAGLMDAEVTLKRQGTAPTVVAGASPDFEADAPDDDVADDGRRILVGKSRWSGQFRQRLSFAGGRYQLGSEPLPLADRVLRQLELADAPLSVTEIQKRVHVRTESVVSELAALRRDGFVAQNDRKGVSITPSGRWRLTSGKAPGKPVTDA